VAKTKGRALSRYEEKRDPSLTNEPFGSDVAERLAPTTRGSFVVHQHDATRMHWDLRLEIGGTLKSFAVPKGPTFDPEVKQLAVHTEDHPIEYLDFEDVIPEGQYGAGAMIAWDRGRVLYVEHDAETGVEKGKIDMLLFGMKLRGRFALVKIKKAEKNEWLLLKKRDEYAVSTADAPESVVVTMPRSILSGLTVDELFKRDERIAMLEKKAEKIGVPVDSSSDRAPSWIRPRLATKAAKASRMHAALGGLRVFATRTDEGTATITMDDGSIAGHDVTAFYPEIARAMTALPAESLVLDGEIVCFDENGRVKTDALRARIPMLRAGEPLAAIREHPAVLVAFDVLRLGATDVSGAKLEERVALLEAIVPELGFVRRAPEAVSEPAPFVGFAREHGLPGAIARDDAAYDEHASWIFLPAAQAGSAFAVVDHGAGGPLTLRHARVTNRTKVFFPELGLTKGDLVDYYVQIAPFLLPYLKERPLVVVRYPDGIHGKSFFQWNVPQASPTWLRTIEVTSDDGKKKHAFVVDDVASLTHVANLGAIPLHVLAFRQHARHLCDFFTIDFDVKEAGLARALPIVKTLKRLLEETGLEGFPKTSGQSGIHVLVPLGEGQSFDVARALCELFGRLLVSEHPKDATMERMTNRRDGKVLIDTGQTGPSRTIVCPYSVRATPEATVSTPLAWDEVFDDLGPSRYTMSTVPKRLAKTGDPMGKMLSAKPDVAAAITKLASMVK
jgi:bifunctional non-homologous end joining protein LigD